MKPVAEVEEIVVVGATGAVGVEFLRVLAARGHGQRRVRVTASNNSVGSRIPWSDRELIVEELASVRTGAGSLLLLATDAAMSKEVACRAVESGARVIDNSSAFRADVAVPLVIPEVNGAVLAQHGFPRLIANPNCSTILMLLALHPLRERFGISFVSVSTYQAISGAGRAAMEELWTQTRDVLEGRPPTPHALPVPCAFNVFPHNSPIDPESGANTEEQKLVAESRRILDAPGLRIEANCVRVPVLRAHSQSIAFQTERRATSLEIADVLRAAPGIRLLEGTRNLPTPLDAAERDEILVGRIRPSLAEGPESFGPGAAFLRHQLWLCGDQLRKGAALNAVQIAEHCGWLPQSKPTGSTTSR